MSRLEIVPIADEGLLSACTPSLMPFHISYSGPAPVSRYLRPRPAPPSSSLASQSSCSSTLVASSSTTSITSEGKTSPTTMSSATSTGNLAEERKSEKNEPLSNASPPCVEMITQMEQVTVAQITEDTTVGMDMDSGTQPASDAVPREDLTASTAPRDIERFVASFRGRQIYGQGVDIPEGYGGLVLRTPLNSKGKDDATVVLKHLSQKAKPKSRTRVTTRRKRASGDKSPEEHERTDDADCDQDADMDPSPLTRKLMPSSKFASFTLWTPDRPLDEGRDEYVRSLMEWTRLASEIHSHDE